VKKKIEITIISMVRFQHKEYIGDVFSSIGLIVTKYDFNPGLIQVFPWLSNIAGCFAEYRFANISFVFASTSSTALGTTSVALGNVIMKFQYDLYAPTDGNQNTLNNDFGVVRGTPSKSLTLQVNPNQAQVDFHRVRATPVPSGQDQRMYDIGYLEVCTVGQQSSNQNLGQLWVVYDIVFAKPRIPIFSAIDTYSARMASTTVTAAAPLTGMVPRFSGSSNMALQITPTVLGFPQFISSGKFLCTYWVYGGTAPTVTNGAIAVLANFGCSIQNSMLVLADGTESVLAESFCRVAPDVNTAVATRKKIMFQFLVVVTAGFASVSIACDAGTLPTGSGLKAYLDVEQVNPNIWV